MNEKPDNFNKRTIDVLTFGETMLRLNAPGYSRLEESPMLEVRIGGSESNTGIALTRLGLRVHWWSRLPANPLGRKIENEIHRWGVETSGVIWDEKTASRAGLYFLDFAVAPRGTEVLYDRAASAASEIRPEDIDEAAIASARLLHLTGITPALSASCAAATAHAISVAKRVGTPVSFDVNYRSKLWDGATARRILEPMLAEIDLLILPLPDAATVFGITGNGAEVARELRAQLGADAVVVTCGADGSCACDASGDIVSPPYPNFPREEPLYRVGSGDAFDAGLLFGFLQNDLALGLEYGAAMAALKHTMPGDLLLATRAEIEAARTGAPGHLRR